MFIFVAITVGDSSFFEDLCAEVLGGESHSVHNLLSHGLAKKQKQTKSTAKTKFKETSGLRLSP